MTTARPVEQSLFPDHAPDRPRGPLVGSVIGGTNADLIAAIAPTYLEGNSVLDVTYGRGGWWTRYQPHPFTFHDIAVDGVDFRHLPESDGSVDVVCYDPPYIPAGGQGTTTAPEYRERFGLAIYRSQAELDQLIQDGLAEVARVARTWVLVKCCDYVNARHFTLGHRKVLDAADKLGLTDNGDPWDLIIHHTGPGPGGHNIYTPLRARRHHSYLLVFQAAG
jgi:hypothetical protein